MWKPSWLKIVVAYSIIGLIIVVGPTALGLALLVIVSIALFGAWVNRYDADYDREFLLTEKVEDPQELLAQGFECWTNVLAKPRYLSDPRSGKIIHDLKTQGYSVRICPKAKDKAGNLISDHNIFSVWRKPTTA